MSDVVSPMALFGFAPGADPGTNRSSRHVSLRGSAFFLRFWRRSCGVFGDALWRQAGLPAQQFAVCSVCVEALLRRVGTVPPRLLRVFEYAEDLALVLKRLFTELQALLELFARWGRVRGLCRQVGRLAWRWPLSWGAGVALGGGARGGGIAVESHAWYPSACTVEGGRGSHASACGGGLRVSPRVARKGPDVWRLRRVLDGVQRLVRRSDAGLGEVYRRAVQLLTGAPWISLNSVVMEALDSLRFLAFVAPLADYLSCNLVLAQAADADEALLVPPRGAFCSGLVAQRWHRVLCGVADRFPASALDAERVVQWALMKSCGADEQRHETWHAR